jgi:hypothetical protein
MGLVVARCMGETGRRLRGGITLLVEMVRIGGVVDISFAVEGDRYRHWRQRGSFAFVRLFITPGRFALVF